jgi:formylglycine-generating enzyme required for sulfatase activity
MIKQILLFSLVIILVTAFIPKKKKEFLPPGTAKINDTLFADETEISNFSWLEYQLWVCNKYGHNSQEYKAVLADTLVWRDKNSYNEPYVQYYLRHPAYRNYPVVGISYEQAVEYCKWRTERVKEFICASKKYDLINFEYRLPTKKEWEFVSSNCVNMFKNGGKNEKGMITFNHRWAKDSAEWLNSDKERAGSEILAPVYSYWPNSFGLFQMIGNVSEMVLEKGISKGGSWTNFLEECRVGKDIPYEKPSAMIGFRCVCVVKKSKC